MGSRSLEGKSRSMSSVECSNVVAVCPAVVIESVENIPVVDKSWVAALILTSLWSRRKIFMDMTGKRRKQSPDLCVSYGLLRHRQMIGH